MDLTQKELKSIFRYNKKTGSLIWKINIVGNNGVGSEAGYILKTGHRFIGYKQKRYLAHRIIWMLLYGYAPKMIDHINHIGSDNRLVNLREVTSRENQRNMKLHKSNTSGFCGVSFVKSSKRWRAYIMINDKQINLGYYENKNEAINARKEANVKHGFHKNHGSK